MSTNANPSRGAFGPAPKAKQPTVPKGLGVFGALNQPSDIYLFGTDGEILNRNATGYNLGGTPPENAPPKFEQIRPGATGKSGNEPAWKAYTATTKYGNAKRYAG